MYKLFIKLNIRRKQFDKFGFIDFFFWTQVEILCNDELLGKSHTLKFVAVTRWRVKVMYMNV